MSEPECVCRDMLVVPGVCALQWFPSFWDDRTFAAQTTSYELQLNPQWRMEGWTSEKKNTPSILDPPSNSLFPKELYEKFITSALFSPFLLPLYSSPRLFCCCLSQMTGIAPHPFFFRHNSATFSCKSIVPLHQHFNHAFNMINQHDVVFQIYCYHI